VRNCFDEKPLRILNFERYNLKNENLEYRKRSVLISAKKRRRLEKEIKIIKTAISITLANGTKVFLISSIQKISGL